MHTRAPTSVTPVSVTKPQCPEPCPETNRDISTTYNPKIPLGTLGSVNPSNRKKIIQTASQLSRVANSLYSKTHQPPPQSIENTHKKHHQTPQNSVHPTVPSSAKNSRNILFPFTFSRGHQNRQLCPQPRSEVQAAPKTVPKPKIAVRGACSALRSPRTPNKTVDTPSTC